ncbi:MAG: CBS domain-containing protein [Cellvibrionaceae bacterium]|jgi:CBS domain-containing protein
MKNSTRFLNAFVTIEEYLRLRTADHDGFLGFSQMLRRVGQKEKGVRSFEFDLKEYAQLRNAIIHERAGDEVIAEPNHAVVLAIERAAELITKPPIIYPLFQRQVITITFQSPLKKALKIMNSSGISKLPVMDQGKCVGILTSNTVTRWLGNCVENEVLNLDETTAGSVMAFARKKDRYTFRSRHTDLFTAVSAFEDYEHRGERLHALLITENGKETEKIMGIMTISDLPTAFRAIDSQ